MPGMIVAFDLSTTNTGIAAAPVDWDGDWSKVLVSSVAPSVKASRGMPESGRTRALLSFAEALAGHVALHKPTTVVFEGYAYNSRTNAVGAGELGMLVRSEVLRAAPHVELMVAPQSAARKLLCGHVRRGKEKFDVAQALIGAGSPTRENFDEYDALCALNWAMSELGGYCFVGRQA